MGPLAKIEHRAMRWLVKQFFTPIPPGGFGSWGTGFRVLRGGGSIDYRKEVGDGLSSSVVMAPLAFIQRTLPEAPLVVGDDRDSILWDHPFTRLVKKPNPYFTRKNLLGALIYSLVWDGNGYLLKVRGQAGAQRTRSLPWNENVSGPVEQLWYAPHFMMCAKWPQDGSTFISHYEYGWGASRLNVDPANVMHFRNGIDPRNMRYGLPMLGSTLREIFTDDEASIFSATMLRNQGQPGMILSPHPQGGEGASEIEGVEAVKEYLKQNFTGEHRGDPLVLGAPTDVNVFGFDPKKMELSNIRNISEERVCAVLGISPAVLSLGTGLETTSVGATLREFMRASYRHCIIPMQGDMAEVFETSLLPDFEPNPEDMNVWFDLSEIQALQPDRRELIEAENIAVMGGWRRVDHAQAAVGFEVDPSQNVYLRQLQVIPEPAQDAKALPGGNTKEATPTEQRVIDTAPEGRPSRRQRDLIRTLERDARKLEKTFGEELESFFSKMGVELEIIAESVLGRKGAPRTGANGTAVKATAQDVDDIIRMMGFNPLEVELSDIAGAHYLSVAKSTYKAIGETLGLAINIPDHRQTELLQAGGRQMGLIDMPKQTRDRLFRELTEGREAGEGVDQLVRRIRDHVPAGRYATPSVRARVIARTETLSASRASSIMAYKDSGVVEQVMIFDARLGPTDAECEALDGAIVSLEEADQLMQDEHINGTRQAVPHFA